MRNKAFLSLAALFLLIFNFLIFQKEDLIRNGQEVFLRLAPVDPRSLMQGDYMELRYAISRDISEKIAQMKFDKPASTFSIQAKANPNHVFEDPLILKDGRPPEADSILLKCRKRGTLIKLGSEAYFFQEGQRDIYQKARYGILRVGRDGEAVLIGLADEERKRITAN